ncbi:MAG TPA: hypothetical protein VIP50_05045 [Agromyces sp.]
MGHRSDRSEAEAELDDGPGLTRWRRRGRAGSTAIFVVIALQVAVPLVALLQPPPQKFGFQMYSGLGAVTATVIDTEGDERPFVEIDRIAAKYRPDTNWLPLLPEAVCAAEHDVVSVTVEQSGRSRSIRCD